MPRAASAKPSRTVVRASAGARRREPAPAAATADGDRTALSRSAWVEAATGVLVDQGIDHVRVDVLARELGVTRGSFYWHFRDREDLLQSVLEAWHASTTEQLTQRLAHAHSDPREQLRDVLTLPFRGRAATRGARIELAIRAWARRDETARHAVDEADARRIAYVAQIFSGLGFAPADARSRAFLLYSYLVGESLMPRQGSAREREDRARFVEALMQRPLAGG